MSATNRKTSYKLPPRDKVSAQEARRIKALEEQKRRRAQKVDESRQLDFFADLSIAENDEEVDNEEDSKKSFAIASVAGYVGLLQTSVDNPPSPVASTSQVVPPFSVSSPPIDTKPRNRKTNKSKSSHKRRADAARNRGNSKWADKCMYAELLEMSGDPSWTYHTNGDRDEVDGLPTDLETAWVAVGPVPVGKRCLAVTHNQAAGAAGSVPNTQLRSRLLGKSLLSPFPSNLPPLTVLDCILDDNWRENGILHVLDVVTWKGQDVSACEAGFRFWWRDTRLGELPTSPPASFRFVKSNKLTSPSTSATTSSTDSDTPQFPYPTTFLPVPYYTSTTLSDLDMQIIPAARSAREVDIIAPASSMPIPAPPISHPFSFGSPTLDADASMDIEPANATGTTFSFVGPRSVLHSQHSTPSSVIPSRVRIQPDGLLLYVAEASYEPGTSPLSSWVPIRSYDDDNDTNAPTSLSANDGPLDLFQRLVRRRIARRGGVPPHFGSVEVSGAALDIDMSMDL